MPVITNIEDLSVIPKRRVPKALFDYVESGAYDENTLRANKQDLDAIPLKQRVLIEVENRSTKAMVLGEEITMPVAIAPTGLTGLIYPNGEIHVCQTAQAFGIPYTLSTVSICSIEDVAAEVSQPVRAP